MRDVFETVHEFGVKDVTVFRSGVEREEVPEADPFTEDCSTECHYADRREGRDEAQ